MNAKKAIRAIERHGVCLVFPIKQGGDCPSLWNEFFPRSAMRWEWDDAGDRRVADLWHLREALSRSGEVVYAKWLKGRATFFSREAFVALHHLLNVSGGVKRDLSTWSLTISEILDDNSPLSTRELKKAAGLQGKVWESTYQKALKVLWERLLIVGFGEVDDGAFPSLAVGSTRHLFEPLFKQSSAARSDEISVFIRQLYSRQPEVEKQVMRIFH